MNEIILNVKGMMCEGCENRVKNAIKNNIDGVQEVSANHTTGKVCVKANREISKKDIEDTIEDIGYEVGKE